MSDALSTDAPETDPAGAASAATPPGDGTAVVEGSAGEAPAVVDAKRFNGLMSAHQKALDALAAERDARIALESRLQDKEQTKPVTETNDSTLAAEVQALRQELAAERSATAKAQALAKYPDAAPFADLIMGNTPQEIESVAAAIAQRMSSVKESLGTITTPPAATEETVVTPPEEVTDAPAPTIPVASGGGTPPAADTTQQELLQKALDLRNYDQNKGTDSVFTERFNDFLAAKVPMNATHNLA